MKTSHNGRMFLGFLLCIQFTSAQAFNIFRHVNGIDSFGISSSMCLDSRYGCGSFYAVEQSDSCFCSCHASNATFAFVNNRWMCIPNFLARNRFQQGCEMKTKISGENADNRIPTLSIGNSSEISLSGTLWELWRCQLDFRSSWFIGCHGSKRLFTQQYYNLSEKLFEITRRPWAGPYVLKVKSGVPSTNLLQGRIVNLFIDCNFGSGSDSIGFCLMFKLEGQTQCPVAQPARPTSSSIDQLKTTLANVSKDSPLETYTKVVQPSSTVALISTSSFNTYLTSVIVEPTVSFRGSNGLKRNTKLGPYLLGLITGLSVCIALLVGLMCYRRRRRYVNRNLPAANASPVGNTKQESVVMVNLHTVSPVQLGNAERVYESLSKEPGDTPIYAPAYSVHLRRSADGSLKSDHTYMNIPVRHHIHGPSHVYENCTSL